MHMFKDLKKIKNETKVLEQQKMKIYVDRIN